MTYFQHNLTTELTETSIFLYDSAVSSHNSKTLTNNQKLKKIHITQKTRLYCKSLIKQVHT